MEEDLVKARAIVAEKNDDPDSPGALRKTILNFNEKTKTFR